MEAILIKGENFELAYGLLTQRMSDMQQVCQGGVARDSLPADWPNPSRELFHVGACSGGAKETGPARAPAAASTASRNGGRIR